MVLFEDDEDEESIPKKSWEEGWNGPQLVRETTDETGKDFTEYINSIGENDSEVSYADLTKKEQRLVDEVFKEDEK